MLVSHGKASEHIILPADMHKRSRISLVNVPSVSSGELIRRDDSQNQWLCQYYFVGCKRFPQTFSFHDKAFT